MSPWPQSPGKVLSLKECFTDGFGEERSDDGSGDLLLGPLFQAPVALRDGLRMRLFEP